MVGARTWVGKCKGTHNGKPCGVLLRVRPSQSAEATSSGPGRIEIPSTTRVTTVVCPICRHKNTFTDAELSEVFAETQP